jgi:DNA-binding transcriptional MerR regulator
LRHASQVWVKFALSLDSRMHSGVDTESVTATYLKSGEVARRSGLSADTLRHYEKLGLLPKALRTEGGYRLYPPETLDRLRTIQSGLRVGFTLSELADFLSERGAGGAPCQRVADVAGRKLEALDGQIADLMALRDFLSNTVAAWQNRLKSLPPCKRAGLLESLARVPQPNAKGTPNESTSASRSKLPRRLSRVDPRSN